MSTIPGYYPGNEGWLHWVGGKIKEVGDWFENTANSIAGIAFVGGALAQPFKAVGLTFDFAGGGLRWADRILFFADQGVKGLFEGDSINKILKDRIWWWDWFRLNPGNFIGESIRVVLNIPDWLKDSPDTWVDQSLRRYISWWSSFSQSPSTFIITQVSGAFGVLAALPGDFKDGMLDHLASWFSIPYAYRRLPTMWPGMILMRIWPTWFDWANDPKQAIANLFGVDKGVLTVFLSSPWDWWKRAVVLHFGMPHDTFDRFPVSVIEWVLDEFDEHHIILVDTVERFSAKMIRYLWERTWGE